VNRLDRRTLLIRGGGLIAAASSPSGWQLVRDALVGVDPRLRSLARAVDGPVITPASRSYGRARLVYNERFDAVHPLGVVQPVSVEDVRLVVAWAKKTGVHLAIRSGGHCYAGYSTTEVSSSI
jgi:hypothetical protein